MKWFLFAAGLASIFPLASWLGRDPRKTQIIWTAIGALPFVWGALPKRKIVLGGEEDWPGFTQGFDVSVLDLFLLVGFLTLPRRQYSPLPFKITFMLYIGAVLLSTLQAPHPAASLYFVWQLFRMFLVFVIVGRACAEPRLAAALLTGLAAGVCFEFLIVGWQRFIEHTVQAPGTFTTQNMLGVSMHFIVYPFFALLLSGQKGWKAGIPIIGVVITIFTTSRASLALVLAGLFLLFAVSMLKRWTPRMTRMLFAAIGAIVILSPVAYRQFGYRFESVEVMQTEDGERSTLNNSAAMILADHPMGIGANNYVPFANANGYSDRANVNSKNREAYPHNIYWTTAAETGYLGISAFVIFLLRPVFFAVSRAWSNRKDPRSDLLVGLATSLMIVYIHSFFEKNFFYDQTQCLFVINLGLIAGLAAQLGQLRRERNRAVQVANQASGSQLFTK